MREHFLLFFFFFYSYNHDKYIYIYIYIYIKAEASTRCCHVREKGYLKKWHVYRFKFKNSPGTLFQHSKKFNFPLTPFESLSAVPICFARASPSDSNSVYFFKKKGVKNKIKKNIKTKNNSLFTLVFIIFSLSKKILAKLRLRESRRIKIPAISSHQSLQGGKKKRKKLRCTGDLFGGPSLFPFEFSRYVLLFLPLFLSMIFHCFDLVLKFLCDFGISFPCFCKFAEYFGFVLRLKP